MTKEEILKYCSWDSYDMASLNVEIPIIEANVKVQFIPELNSGKSITETMANALNDVLNLSANQIVEIKRLSFQYFNLCCEVTNYGYATIDGEICADANKRYFEVNNEEDAWEKSKLDLVVIEESDDSTSILCIDVPWDDEHGCEIKIVNGEIVGFE